MKRALSTLVGLIALALPGTAAALPAQVRDYDLGRIELPDPGPKGPVPIRLWGAIGAPTAAAAPGPRPLVLVLHGRHDTNCPFGPADAPIWPCFAREQRNDLGLRHVVRALAERGMVAVAPDLNGGFTTGWGEPDDLRRWPRLVIRLLDLLTREATTGGGRFGLPLQGRVDLAPHRVCSAIRSAATGRCASPAGTAARGCARCSCWPRSSAGCRSPTCPPPSCSARATETPGTMGREYLARARRDPDRRRRVFLARLEQANHNYFNRTLSRLRRNDAPSRCDGSLLRPADQQAWVDRAAADFFAATLLGSAAAGVAQPRCAGAAAGVRPAGAGPARLARHAVGRIAHDEDGWRPHRGRGRRSSVCRACTAIAPDRTARGGSRRPAAPGPPRRARCRRARRDSGSASRR